MPQDSNDDTIRDICRDIGPLLSAAIAALLFGSTMILSAVGPATASEAPALAGGYTAATTLRYLA